MQISFTGCTERDECVRGRSWRGAWARSSGSEAGGGHRADANKNRGTNDLRELARGPGRLTEALGIDKREDGVDLCKSKSLWLGAARTQEIVVARSTRIGITKEADRVLRFFERHNVHVSGPKRLNR